MSEGTTYGGRYEILEVVGAGGMAQVHRARDTLLGREVAVKVLAERFSQDRAFVERFRREAQSAANLNHPNIVSLYDYGSDGGSYYIVMEFIEGRSLAEILSSEGRLLPERAAEIASDVAKALERAHGAGIVHRDIKPGNIMITSNGQTKVTDFGIARAVGGQGDQTMTQTGMVIGTASYLSPEQAQGDPVDARSDVYSLGIVLYEMLAGTVPFSGDTPLSIAYKHVREMPRPVSELNPDVPNELSAIVMKALAKNPDNRYLDAGEMQQDLERFSAGQTVLATPMMPETSVVPATGTQVIDRADLYEEEPEESKAGMYVLGALLALGVIGLLAWLLASTFLGQGDPVEVPNVVGMQEDEARETLEEAGLEVSVVRRPNKADEGEVFKQDPEAETMVTEGDTVEIRVSRGVRRVEVPNVVGEQLEDAEEILDEAGLRVEVVDQPTDDAEVGEVMSQAPNAGETVNEGTRVTLTVAAEPEAGTVPSVIGFNEDAAVSAIENADFTPEVTYAASDQDEGLVISQDPEGGAEAAPGSTVRIVVSEGPEEEPMPNVTSQDADEAQALLEDQYGLEVTQTNETQACAEPPGRVCRQEPEEGTPVSPGDQATLYVQGGGAGLPSLGRWFAFLSLFYFV